MGKLTDTGELEFIALARIRTHRIKDKGGLFRWYNDYRLPQGHYGAPVTVRLHNNEQDVGHARQHVNLIGYALMVNSLTLFEHQQRPPSSASAA